MSKLLDDIFNTPEEQLETFSELLKSQGTIISKSDTDKWRQETPDQVKYPHIVDQTSGLIRIQHGVDDPDYVWHIGNAHIKRPFKVSEERVMYAIIKCMQPVIHDSIQVKIWAPYKDWDIQEITFKAIGYVEHWSFNEVHIHKLNEKLFEVLNTLV